MIEREWGSYGGINFEIIDPQEVTDKLGRGKARRECTTTECLVEVCHATGAVFAVQATAARLGDKVVIDLALFDATDRRVVNRSSSEIANNENLFGDAVRKAAQTLTAARIQAAPARVSGGTPAASTVGPALREDPALPQDQATIVADSAPPGAYLIVDGKVVGRTPIEQTVTPGKHKIAIELPGHTPYSGTVTLGVGEKVKRVAGLKSVGGELAKRYVGLGLGWSLVAGGVVGFLATIGLLESSDIQGVLAWACIGSAIAGGIIVAVAPSAPPRPFNPAPINDYERRRNTTAIGAGLSVSGHF
ncbi:MAG: PEGA domain-containing protein [Deltaproteobacteria bacterium]|nr:PEGA domain-containing protein [Deltaproteobacteria bacterium]